MAKHNKIDNMRPLNVGYNIGEYDGFYGKFFTNGYNKCFRPIGTAVHDIGLYKDVETGEYSSLLEFVVPGGEKTQKLVRREDLLDTGMMKKFAAYGMSITTKDASALQQYLNQQFEAYQGNVKKYHTSIGWLELPCGTCYMAYNAIGTDSIYRGTYDLKPGGTMEKWKDMVETYVLDSPALSLVLIIALSAVLVGFLNLAEPISNPIVSLSGNSSSGKTTAGILAASVAFQPMQGSRTVNDPLDGTKQLIGGMFSWDATQNALLGRMQGNYGMPVILDELSRSDIPSLSSTVYAFSDGVGKSRMTKECALKPQRNFHTTIISIGEERLTDKCRTQNAGAFMRILEIPSPFTDSASQANAIKWACQNNYGHAAPILAAYIREMGLEKLSDLFHKKGMLYRKRLTDTAYSDRRAQQFGGLILTTASVAKKALGINFRYKKIRDFLLSCDEAGLTSCDTSQKAYEDFINWVSRHSENFRERSEKEHFGRLYEKDCIPMKNHQPKNLIRQIAIIPYMFEHFCVECGYSNSYQILKDWISKGLAIAEDGKHTLRRNVNGIQQAVYVVCQFCRHGDERTIEENWLAREARECSFRDVCKVCSDAKENKAALQNASDGAPCEKSRIANENVLDDRID